jgi:integrase/recombinase XerD
MRARPVRQRLRRRASSRAVDTPVWADNGLVPYVSLYVDWSSMTATAATVLNRRKTLERLVAWCDTRGLGQPVEITRAVLEAYQRHLYLYRKENGQPLSIRSQRALLSPLVGWFRWLARERYVEYNVAGELVLPRKPLALPKVVLSVMQVERLMAQPDLEAVTGVRDRAMLELLYSTGMRRMELVQLSVSDVAPETRTVAIRSGKGRRDRFVPMGERACYWVERYLSEERTLLTVRADEWSLFLTDWGTPFELGQLSGTVSRYMRRAGIQEGSCHALRHACATHMLENGADVRFIQVLLGHAELTSTQIYTQVAIGKLREIHAATHPARLTHSDASGDAVASLFAALDAEADEDLQKGSEEG